METYVVKFTLLCLSLFLPFTLMADTKIFAHRGAQAEFPENTLYAYEHSLKRCADGLEVDVQLTKDNVVVLFHPDDLSAKTNGKGLVSAYTYQEISALDAAYHFDPERNQSFPQRGKGHKIPTLSECLQKFPTTEIVVDMKSQPAKPLVKALVKVVDQQNAWKNLLFYSTDPAHLTTLKKLKPEARLFENRDHTRARLLTLRNQSLCLDAPEEGRYAGFELDREMQVEEQFKLGKGISRLHFRLWDEAAVKCTKDPQKIVIFGINDKNAYQTAVKLGVYGVFSDNPSQLR